MTAPMTASVAELRLGPAVYSGLPLHWVERDTDPHDGWATLTHPERARFAAACTRRRVEFATARLCAREALDALGMPGQAPGTGAHRAPTWPAGVVGSITHSGRLRAAAVAWSRDCAGLGIDIEPDDPLPSGVGHYVLRDEELTMSAGPWPVHADRLVFCIKEAVYKIWSPMNADLRKTPGFHDVCVSLHCADGRRGGFRAVLDPSIAGRCPSEITGHWSGDGGVLRVLAMLPPPLRRSSHQSSRPASHPVPPHQGVSA